MQSYKPLILVVDDNETVAHTLALLLEHSGYNAISATNGGEAVDIAAGIAIDAAVVDIQMPGIDGLQTAVEICKRLPNCKIILISGRPESMALLELAAQQGCAYPVLAKPIPPADLLSTLESLLVTTSTIDVGRGTQPRSPLN